MVVGLPNDSNDRSSHIFSIGFWLLCRAAISMSTKLETESPIPRGSAAHTDSDQRSVTPRWDMHDFGFLQDVVYHLEPFACIATDLDPFFGLKLHFLGLHWTQGLAYAVERDDTWVSLCYFCFGV